MVNIVDYKNPADSTWLPAFNAAKAALGSNGGIIYFPQGQYNFKGTILLDTPLILRGEGISTSYIRFLPKTDNSIYNGIEINHANCIIQNFLISGSSAGSIHFGVLMNEKATLINCTMSAFRKAGTKINGSVENWGLTYMHFAYNGKDGITCNGSHGISIGLDSFSNSTQEFSWGLFDTSLKGNSYIGSHVDAGDQGEQNGYFLANAGELIGSYVEGNNIPPAIINKNAIWIPGHSDAPEGNGFITKRENYLIQEDSKGIDHINQRNADNIVHFVGGGEEAGTVLEFGGEQDFRLVPWDANTLKIENPGLSEGDIGILKVLHDKYIELRQFYTDIVQLEKLLEEATSQRDIDLYEAQLAIAKTDTQNKGTEINNYEKGNEPLVVEYKPKYIVKLNRWRLKLRKNHATGYKNWYRFDQANYPEMDEALALSTETTAEGMGKVAFPKGYLLGKSRYKIGTSPILPTTSEVKIGDLVYNQEPIVGDPIQGFAGWIYTEVNGQEQWQTFGQLV